MIPGFILSLIVTVLFSLQWPDGMDREQPMEGETWHEEIT